MIEDVYNSLASECDFVKVLSSVHFSYINILSIYYNIFQSTLKNCPLLSSHVCLHTLTVFTMSIHISALLMTIVSCHI